MLVGSVAGTWRGMRKPETAQHIKRSTNIEFDVSDVGKIINLKIQVLNPPSIHRRHDTQTKYQAVVARYRQN